jgi:hypothetical protein
MRIDEEKFEYWLETCRAIDQKIKDKKQGKNIQQSEKHLNDMRDYAFMQVEHSTVEHIIVIHRLKKELNLYTNYDKA